MVAVVLYLNFGAGFGFSAFYSTTSASPKALFHNRYILVNLRHLHPRQTQLTHLDSVVRNRRFILNYRAEYANDEE
jgi:hypothetical protein